jgi:hypothetical protein
MTGEFKFNDNRITYPKLLMNRFSIMLLQNRYFIPKYDKYSLTTSFSLFHIYPSNKPATCRLLNEDKYCSQQILYIQH